MLTITVGLVFAEHLGMFKKLQHRIPEEEIGLTCNEKDGKAIISTK